MTLFLLPFLWPVCPFDCVPFITLSLAYFTQNVSSSPFCMSLQVDTFPSLKLNKYSILIFPFIHLPVGSDYQIPAP